MTAERACRVCGCTDTHACPGGCWWVDADLCSACVGASGELPVSAAERLATEHGQHQVIVLCWDGQRTHVVTWGDTPETAAQAAEAGNRIKRFLGWPEDLCRAESAKVARMRARIAELEGRLQEGGSPCSSAT